MYTIRNDMGEPIGVEYHYDDPPDPDLYYEYQQKRWWCDSCERHHGPDAWCPECDTCEPGCSNPGEHF